MPALESGGECQHLRVEESASNGEWRRVPALESGGECQQWRMEESSQQWRMEESAST